MKKKANKYLFYIISIFFTLVISLSNINISPSNKEEFISYEEDSLVSDYENYCENKTENFLYNLINTNLKTKYETFTGYLTLDSKNDEDDEIYGISYVDYQDGYIDDDGKVYFSSGFLKFQNNKKTKKYSVNDGLEITSLNEYSEDFSYVYSYTTENVHSHFVYDNKYIQYDIVDDEIKYNEFPYFEGMDVDYTRGNIYNYDTNDYVYIVEEIKYKPVNAISLIGESDYNNIIQEVNNIIYNQQANLTYEELQTYVYQAKEVINSYLLSLQEEKFLGVPTKELIKQARQLDAMHHIRITVNKEGLPSFEIIEVEKLATKTEKILVSFICATAIVGGVVCSVLGCPIVGGAFIGFAIEAFSQVVISDNPISDVQWEKLLIATVAGAIGGGISSAISSIGGSLLFKETIDTFCDALIGGGEYFTFSLIDGQSFEEAFQNFGVGFMTGVFVSGAFKIGSKVIKEGSKLINKKSSSLLDTIGNKNVKNVNSTYTSESQSFLTEKAFEKAIKENIDDGIYSLTTFFDDNGNVYRIGDYLIPDNNYTINNYNYWTDDSSRIVRAYGDLYDFTGKRGNIKDTMDSIGKGYELITDHRGHIIAFKFGGSDDLGNIVAQNGKLNQSKYKALENTWTKALDNGKNVTVDIKLSYTDGSFRPHTFDITYYIDNIENNITFNN